MNPNNPLSQYFRQPALYIRLPSQGNFYPEGTLAMPQNGELPVLPMTAIDEITYRTPDALFNGQAVVSVIESCVPNIKDGWSVPSIDIDAILVGIRIASYGQNMDFSTECPQCQTITELALDLRTVLAKMKTPDFEHSIKHGDIEIFFKPLSYKEVNSNNQVQFEEQRALQMLPDLNDNGEANQEKVMALSHALKKLTEITVRTIAQSVSLIRTPNAMVNQPEFIQEFFKNCDRSLFNDIRDHLVKIKSDSELQPVDLTCPECQFKYEQQLTLDMTSFFDRAS